MTCQDYKDLMMGYLDNELDDDQKQIFEQHLLNCSDCKKELQEFRQLKEITDEVHFVELEDRIWDRYWSGVYNRIERGVGWILSSVAAIILLIYVGFKAIEDIIKDPTLGILLKVALLMLITGIATLFVSVLREKLYFRKKDRYKDVRR
ncbi:MAG: zf-HC2 domain-containing protein [Sedimentisphaerales bacterium]|nr:zf-HC2 domain-containing protein [Sedimentisphaerales bacterium]